MIERAEAVGQFPARRSAFDDPRLQAALPIPADRVRSIIGSAVARPATPVYSQLSGILQIHLHRALSGQVAPRPALEAAAAEMRALLASAGLAR
jgi:multiple sugar transport system substrate-binding protein